MSTLLFGGTFDPPHTGHMDLLRNAIEAVRPGRVVVVPAAVPPHKAASETPPALRMAMCRCFLPLFKGLEISSVEMERPGRSYTVDTVEDFQAASPNEDFYLVVGGDMLASFTRWHRWQDLLHLTTLVVQARTGEMTDLGAAARPLEEAGGRVLFAPGSAAAVSSTQIREGLAAGRDMLGLVPPPADDIIRQHHLYGYEA